jgi:hypothetical protein
MKNDKHTMDAKNMPKEVSKTMPNISDEEMLYYGWWDDDLD